MNLSLNLPQKTAN